MLAAIFGCAGLRLEAAERRFFAEADPFGFILFSPRNIRDPGQVRALTAELQDCLGRRAPILIDQEGGRVQRLTPPHWRRAPAAAIFGAMGREAGARAAELNARLIAGELFDLGIAVNCAPVLDLRFEETHAAIGDRAIAGDPELVAAIGRATARGFLSQGVAPVIKHIPGHGRARVDSHHALPVVEAPAAALRALDFTPFRALADLPAAMTAHLLYPAFDRQHPATLSSRIVGEVIRGEIGFDGLLMSDDLSMAALCGGIGARAAAARAAGCDLALHCNADMAEMRAVAEAAGALTGAAARRAESFTALLARIAGDRRPLDAAAVRRELDRLLA